MRGDEISKKLSAAARLLSKRGAWVRGADAKLSPRGAITRIADPHARCFCTYGAAARAFGDEILPQEALRRVYLAIGEPLPMDFIDGVAIVEWNDEKATQRLAVAALRKAARL